MIKYFFAKIDLGLALCARKEDFSIRLHYVSPPEKSLKRDSPLRGVARRSLTKSNEARLYKHVFIKWIQYKDFHDFFKYLVFYKNDIYFLRMR